MPCSEEIAKSAIKRLRALRYHDDAERRSEAGRALMSAADNDRHAEAMVDAILRGEADFPTPSVIWTYAERIAPPQTLVSPRQDCPHCAGTGFRQVRVSGCSAVQPCECRRAKT